MQKIFDFGLKLRKEDKGVAVQFNTKVICLEDAIKMKRRNLEKTVK